MKLDIKIYGTHKRDSYIQAYKEILPIEESDIIYDDRPNGGNAYYTCKKAWLQPIPEDVTHRLCLPDDMELCDNFLERLEKIIKVHPDKILCLFPYDYNEKIPNVYEQKTPYYKVNTMSGCGVVFPVNYIKPCFEWIDKVYFVQEKIIDDVAMANYFNTKHIPYITTIPSLVQHVGDDSLIDPLNPVRRTKFFIDDLKNIDSCVDWDTEEVDWVAPFYYNEKKKLPSKMYFCTASGEVIRIE